MTSLAHQATPSFSVLIALWKSWLRVWVMSVRHLQEHGDRGNLLCSSCPTAGALWAKSKREVEVCMSWACMMCRCVYMCFLANLSLSLSLLLLFLLLNLLFFLLSSLASQCERWSRRVLLQLQMCPSSKFYFLWYYIYFQYFQQCVEQHWLCSTRIPVPHCDLDQVKVVWSERNHVTNHVTSCNV